MISSWVIRYFSQDKGIIGKLAYAENDPVVRNARVRSSSDGSVSVSAESPSQSLSIIASPSRSSTGGFWPLKYFTTWTTQRFGRSKVKFRRTFFQLLRLVIHDHARGVNRLHQVTSLGVPNPILPVEKYSFSDRLDQRFFYKRPVSGAHKRCGLLR